MPCFAHSVEGRPETEWEALGDHLALVARYAMEAARFFGGQDLVQVMALLHDIGKVAPAYLDYIRGSGKAGVKGPDHSSAGAQEAVRLYGSGLGRLLAFGIAGHHAGLMNGEGDEGPTLNARLCKAVEPYGGWQAYTGVLPELKTLQASMPRLSPNVISKAFSPFFLTRMLFSSLVDADFLATEHFLSLAMQGIVPSRGGILGPAHLDILRAYLAQHRRSDTPVNRLRSEILDHANSKASLAPGLFTLTVPTGGGKTLTSLSFAMEHAALHKKRRILYVIPFTSIIEQTAQIFRDEIGFGDDVLEHHSNFDWDQRSPDAQGDEDGEGRSGLAKLRRDMQNWDSPLVVTTAVQFFESLFAARTSQVRKLHNLADSVIILDEVQSLPLHLLRPCMAAIDELARNYGASIVLCTATQPALRQIDRALRPEREEGESQSRLEGLDIPACRELAPDPAALYSALRRVRVVWRETPVGDEEIAQRFAEQPSMLCIVNSRAHARALFEAISHQEGAFHLTTLMCPRHRSETLAVIRARLNAGAPVRLVSTSLVEAGVDLSFHEVWRAAAGLASIAQAAGRCNRHGELGPLDVALGRVVVFEPAARKGQKPIPDALIPFVQAAREARREMGRSGEADLLGLEAISAYHKWLYWNRGYEALDQARMPNGERYVIMEAIIDTCRKLDFPFADIAEAFRLIDTVMEPVLIPWDDTAREALHVLEMAEIPPVGIQRRLQQYSVPVPAQLRPKLLANGAARAIRPADYGDRFIVLEQKTLYDEKLGLCLDDTQWRPSEENVI